MTVLRSKIAPSLEGPLIGIATAAAYLGAAWLTLRFVLQLGGTAAVWPPAGVALAIMTRAPKRLWAWVAVGIVGANVAANLIPDAHLAALAIEHGLTLCSTDGDFARFPDLRWDDPLKQ